MYDSYRKSGKGFTVNAPRIKYREVVVHMERPKEPGEGQSGADVLLCTFKSTNAAFSSFPMRKLLS
jgi:hypothetical protein